MSFIRPVGIPTIDWTHPLAANLVGCWLPDGLNPLIDLTGNHPPLTQGSIGTPSSNSFGPAASFNGTSQGAWEAGTCAINGLSTATFASVFAPKTSPSFPCAALECASSLDFNSRAGITYTNAAPNPSCHVDIFPGGVGAGTPGVASTVTLTPLVPIAVMGSVLLGSATGLNVYVSGILKLTQDLSTFPTAFDYDTLCTGVRKNGNGVFTGTTTLGSNTISSVTPVATLTGNIGESQAIADTFGDIPAGATVISASSGNIVFSGSPATGSHASQTITASGPESFFGGLINMNLLYSDAKDATFATAWAANPCGFLVYPPAWPSFRFRN